MLSREPGRWASPAGQGADRRESKSLTGEVSLQIAVKDTFLRGAEREREGEREGRNSREE